MTLERVGAAGQTLTIQQLQARSAERVGSAGAAKGAAFADVLKTKLAGLTFSAHATSRMTSRNIELSAEQMGKLEKAVSSAALKGARDSLVLMKNCAFIVNVPNRTVITAMDGESMKENIFTNIDSAVIAD